MPRFLAPLLCLLLTASEAHAYCRSTTCNQLKEDCEVDEDGCKTLGYPLYWASSCVGFSINTRGSDNLQFADIEESFELALSAWTQLECGNGQATFAYKRQEDSFCPVEHNKKGPNANVLVFRDDNWPYEGISNTLGYTTIVYSVSTGEILGADIEVNTGQNIITTDHEAPQYDLRAILTHELGHALGLGHSPDPEATMVANYEKGTTGMRELAQDDVDALCAAYPPGRKARCSLAPPGGFSACLAAPPEANAPSAPSCSQAPAGHAGFFPWLSLLALALRRRR